ncbi:MAG: hypothetical protein AUJ98_09635 [Bacteroidetes bacterium CG2_30_33_31]|nr:MAG: hypothetical protein AUJ98_09635 [Bacteroidetes bacterium CG2_30_33_31]
MSKIGIRHEDKYLLEKRVSITPNHIEKLKENTNLHFYVQSSKKRIFTDDEYERVGATIVDEFPEDVKTIFGVKEMPNDFFREGDNCIFFSHIIKGQPYNMPMLKKMMAKKINLIEYERIVDENGKRLIFFGRFAGLAGSLNSLWSLGERLKRKGIANPFTVLKQAHKYNSLNDAIIDFYQIAKEIRTNGLPKEICPMVIGITGYGNASKGAQEMLDILPIVSITPKELLSLDLSQANNKNIYKVIFKEEDISKPIKKDAEFILQDYYNHPEKFVNQFDKYVPFLTIILNCMYWDPNYPRIITKDFLESHFREGNHRLEVIGDISCDPDGSIECTHKGTTIQDPVFVYNPITRQPTMGFEGEGILVMSVDILPSEVPRESSLAFGDALLPYISDIANADFSKDFENLDLPPEILKALILHNGELTPDYKYIAKYLVNTNQ